MTSLYQQQNADTFTDIGINTANPNRIASDICSQQKRLASKRMECKGSIYSQFPWPLYDYDGQRYSLRVW